MLVIFEWNKCIYISVC